MVPATLSYDNATNTARSGPNQASGSGVTYSVTVTGSDRPTTPSRVVRVVVVTTGGLAACPCGIFSSTSLPAGAAFDPTPTELGVKFLFGLWTAM